MQSVAINVSDVSQWVSKLWWPALRIAGFVATAPIASEKTIPSRVKIVLTLALAVLLAPAVPVPDNLSILSGSGVLAAVQEVLIGVAIGMVVEIAFEALTFAGQAVATAMGLGFATLIDPQRGANVPVVGQLVMIMGVLTYLALNGHLVLIGALVHSFQSLPIGGGNIDKDFLLSVATWGGRIFETGLLVALPSVVALIIVNMALGVVTRAAPQLNLFGIGFTITLLGGFFILMVGLDGLMAGISNLITGALAAVVDLVDRPIAVAH